MPEIRHMGRVTKPLSFPLFGEVNERKRNSNSNYQTTEYFPSHQVSYRYLSGKDIPLMRPNYPQETQVNVTRKSADKGRQEYSKNTRKDLMSHVRAICIRRNPLDNCSENSIWYGITYDGISTNSSSSA